MSENSISVCGSISFVCAFFVFRCCCSTVNVSDFSWWKELQIYQIELEQNKHSGAREHEIQNTDFNEMKLK